MQAQDAPTLFLIKFWPWVVANSKRLIAAGIAIAVAIFGFVFYSAHQSQKEIDAGSALSHALFENRGVESLVAVANNYPGTRAGQRALLQAAQSYFITGKYTDAQTQFQKFLDLYPDSDFAAEASLGIASSLEAQGKMDLAGAAYQKVINQSAPMTVAVNAKFSLARIAEQQGKTADAEKIYEDIAKQNQGSPYAQEAAMRAMELKTGANTPSAAQTSVPAKTNSAAPAFQLTH